MKRFLAFVRKEFTHILRDKLTLLILFGLPIAQVLIFGFALTNEIRHARIGILDFDRGLHSQSITRELLSSGYFNLEKEVHSYDEIEGTFRKGKIKIIIVYPPNFSYDIAHSKQAQVQLISDASDQNTAITLDGYASGIINGYANSFAPAGTTPPIRLDIQPRFAFNPELKGAFIFVPGVMAMVLLLVSVMMTSITIAREKETGTMEVLLVSPLSQAQILLGKVLPYLVLSFINGCLIIAMGVFLLGIPMAGSLPLLLAETILFIFLALSLGILISTLASTQLVAIFASQIGMLMPTIFLSGFVFPIESMPWILQKISYVIPARHFITIVKGIMIKGQGLDTLWPETIILAVEALFFIGLSIRQLKPRLE